MWVQTEMPFLEQHNRTECTGGATMASSWQLEGVKLNYPVRQRETFVRRLFELWNRNIHPIPLHHFLFTDWRHHGGHVDQVSSSWTVLKLTTATCVLINLIHRNRLKLFYYRLGGRLASDWPWHPASGPQAKLGLLPFAARRLKGK